MNAELSQLGRAAMRYAELGFAVFPCEPRGEKSRAHGTVAKTRLAISIRSRKWWTRWPDSNVAIATLASSPVLVLDIDPRHGGDDLLATLGASFRKLPETPTVLTGGGGLQIHSAIPELRFRTAPEGLARASTCAETGAM